MPLGRVERLQIMLTNDELAVIDNWRFARRMPSRAAAIRELLKRGLAAEGFVLADRAVRSKDFGVVPAKRKRGLSTEPNSATCPRLDVTQDGS